MPREALDDVVDARVDAVRLGHDEHAPERAELAAQPIRPPTQVDADVRNMGGVRELGRAVRKLGGLHVPLAIGWRQQRRMRPALQPSQGTTLPLSVT